MSPTVSVRSCPGVPGEIRVTRRCERESAGQGRFIRPGTARKVQRRFARWIITGSARLGRLNPFLTQLPPGPDEAVFPYFRLYQLSSFSLRLLCGMRCVGGGPLDQRPRLTPLIAGEAIYRELSSRFHAVATDPRRLGFLAYGMPVKSTGATGSHHR